MIAMNEEPLEEARIRRGRTSHQGATQNDSDSVSDSDNDSERSYHSDSEYTQDEGVAGLALVSINSYDIFDSPNEGIGRCFMAKGPR